MLEVESVGGKSGVWWLQEQFDHELRDGRLKPIIDTVLPLADAADAHRRMASNQHFGKIVLSVQAL